MSQLTRVKKASKPGLQVLSASLCVCAFQADFAAYQAGLVEASTLAESNACLVEISSDYNFFLACGQL